MWTCGYSGDSIFHLGNIVLVTFMSIFVYLLSSPIQDNHKKRAMGHALVNRVMTELTTFVLQFKASTVIGASDEGINQFNAMVIKFRILSSAWVRAIDYGFKGELNAETLIGESAEAREIIALRFPEDLAFDDVVSTQTLTDLYEQTLELITAAHSHEFTWRADKSIKNLNNLYETCQKLMLYRKLAFSFARKELGNVSLFCLLTLVSVMSITRFGPWWGILPTLLVVYFAAGVWVSSFKSVEIWQGRNPFALCGDMHFDDIVLVNAAKIQAWLDNWSGVSVEQVEMQKRMKK